ncbi:MAG: hypothetical protein R3Y27_06625 [Clostridia bacterium]
MSTLIDSYNQVSRQLRTINLKIIDAEQEINHLKLSQLEDSSKRILNLEEHIVKIDDYLVQIKTFEEIAKQNLDSPNILTIEAPSGYRVNLTRLRNWLTMVDPASTNDPYAQRVYIVCQCDRCFLEKKRKEYEEKIELLKQEQLQEGSGTIANLSQTIASLKQEVEQYTQTALSLDETLAQIIQSLKGASDPATNVAQKLTEVTEVYDEIQKEKEVENSVDFETLE